MPRPAAKDFFSQNSDDIPDETSGASDISSASYDSINEYLRSDNETIFDCSSSIDNSTEDDSQSAPSLIDELSLASDSEDEDDDTVGGGEATDTSTCASIEFSAQSSIAEHSDHSIVSENEAFRDILPKSFLQLKGITVGNFNMGCNFRIDSAIILMIQYKLDVLAVQEHTPWNRELSESEVSSIQRHCDKWGYFVAVSKLQIIFVDKQLTACHRKTDIYEDGRLMHCRFEVSTNQFVSFFPVYGIPHTGGEKLHSCEEDAEENDTLQRMTALQTCAHRLLTDAIKSKDVIFVFGDLQDTPDNSKLFHYGSCRLPKHPLGIVSQCEALGLVCSVYNHMDSLEKPIISRHGSKGGRFIDGMYTCQQGLQKITGISIVIDSGIPSDHCLIASKIDLGIENFQVSKQKEERLDFRQIMNIPVRLLPGADHPSLNDTVFKGVDFQAQAALYGKLQSIINDPANGFLEKLSHIEAQLQNLETDIIAQTKLCITPQDQLDGKLIQRTKQDAATLNEASAQFFELLNDITRQADLARKVSIIPSATLNRKKQEVLDGQLIPGIASVPLTKQLDDVVKRSRHMKHRIILLLKALRGVQICNMHKIPNKTRKAKWDTNILTNIRRMLQQREVFAQSVGNTIQICITVAKERADHVLAIELARNKKLYDVDHQYVDSILEKQDQGEHDLFLHTMKANIFGQENIKTLEMELSERQPPHLKLQRWNDRWEQLLEKIVAAPPNAISEKTVKRWYLQARKAKRLMNTALRILRQIQRREWSNAKNHFIRIGQFGPLARMVNPKPRSGPTASAFYPAHDGLPPRRAINDRERKEASMQTHELWMSNPPGVKNCHFLDSSSDEVGPHAVVINPDKKFDEEAEKMYLDGMLNQKVSEEIATRIKSAHTKLPALFRRIQTDQRIVYPFKYDCVTGVFMYPLLEKQLRKNVCQGNGKARATGFAIPVLGRLPRTFLDVYIKKCQIQLTLRLLDMGTESSLRICIGKPCGGVRPLTVGHDDNVFLNGIAQQAIQQEIARLNVLPENICSYQKGKGCADATIVDCIVKEIAVQDDTFYLGELVDDAEKMFDRLYLELQAVLLMLAGAGLQGFTEWQCANMVDRTNTLVTDIFIALLKYICGLPQGSSFSVEIANLYAMMLLMWWNMDPINPAGTIVPFTSPRHAFPLIAGGILKPVSSLAYVDDAKRFAAMLKSMHTCEEFFDVVQGYCDLLADLSLVIKMGRNVRKCTIYLYNIPENVIIPSFTSIAWSYDAQGPVKGNIEVVVMKRDCDGRLLCYDVEKSLRNKMPDNIKNIMAVRKYLGVADNAQLDNTDGKEKIVKKMSQRIGLVSNKANCIKEARLTHNMLVCQVATFSPICISMSLSECTAIDKQLLTSYHYRLKYMASDAKHSIFISEKKGGIGIRSFTREYLGALLRDVEVFITNEQSLPAHALMSSIEAATKQNLWNLYCENKLPRGSMIANSAASIKISPKKTLSFYEDDKSPIMTTISFDHKHTMEKAIRTTSLYGFILRDLKEEFTSRFSDELLLKDRYAYTIGSPSAPGRARLNACIGDGCARFCNYSILGRYYLILQGIFAEAKNDSLMKNGIITIDEVERLVTYRPFYANLKAFPKEISATQLAITARSCLAKLRNDYKIGSFYNMVEWRCSLRTLTHPGPQKPRAQDYKVIIKDDNVFRPSLLESMHENSIKLSDHLKSILCLEEDEVIISETIHEEEEDRALSDLEIIEHAMQHDMPIFVSIDGGLKNGNATVCITLLAPDIRETDNDEEWHSRPAIALLIRSWQLPRQWGTSSTCINMAESLGFIIGEYTIPSDLPVIYITDSNNARTLQRNVKHAKEFTHRKLVRTVKQGIDYSIANHLEYLTSKWPRPEQMSLSSREIYRRGEELCQSWTKQVNTPKPTMFIDDSTDDSIEPWDEDDSTVESTSSMTPTLQAPTKNRYRFDDTMLDCHGRIIVVKVYSHQLNKDFTVKTAGMQPSPNLFVTSSNQYADNAADQAMKIFENYDMTEYKQCFYPPFSPRWSFSFEGCITNKGATKVLQDKMDEELIQRQQLRVKQGLFLRMSPFHSLKTDQIGDESILRNLLKMTAMCWTRTLGTKHHQLVLLMTN